MRRRNNTALAAGLGCGILLMCVLVATAALAALVPARMGLFDSPFGGEPEAAVTRVVRAEPAGVEVDVPSVRATQEAIPTLPAVSSRVEETAARPGGELAPPGTAFQPGVSQPVAPFDGDYLTNLYTALTPGVVSIRILAESPIGVQEGAGSGFVLDVENGYIVTNNHVVQDANNLRVIFYDGYEANAEVVGNDDDSDIAVIRVDSVPEGAIALPLADSSTVAPGEWVVAIGNPFGFTSSMTLGIVSAVGRAVEGLVPSFSIPEVIQTDAPINPGNSGGPLLNMRGEIVGVNAQIRNAQGVRANSGVGFAIPSNIVRLIAPVLISEGSYQWPYLGISGFPYGVDLAHQRANDLPDQRGSYVVFVQENSAAARAGLRGSERTTTVLGQAGVGIGGDVIIAYNGEPVHDFYHLLGMISFSEVGEEVILTVRRNGDTIEIPVTLGARPERLSVP